MWIPILCFVIAFFAGCANVSEGAWFAGGRKALWVGPCAYAIFGLSIAYGVREGILWGLGLFVAALIVMILGEAVFRRVMRKSEGP